MNNGFDKMNGIFDDAMDGGGKFDFNDVAEDVAKNSVDDLLDQAKEIIGKSGLSGYKKSQLNDQAERMADYVKADLENAVTLDEMNEKLDEFTDGLNDMLENSGAIGGGSGSGSGGVSGGGFLDSIKDVGIEMIENAAEEYKGKLENSGLSDYEKQKDIDNLQDLINESVERIGGKEDISDIANDINETLQNLGDITENNLNPAGPNQKNLGSSYSIDNPGLENGVNKGYVVMRIWSDVSGAVFIRFSSYGDYTGTGWTEADPYWHLLDEKYPMYYLNGVMLASIGLEKATMKIKNGTQDYLLPYYLSKEVLNYDAQYSDVKFAGDVPDEYWVYYYPFDYLKQGDAIALGSLAIILIAVGRIV